MKHEKYFNLKKRVVSKPAFLEKGLADSYCFAYSGSITYDLDSSVWEMLSSKIYSRLIAMNEIEDLIKNR
jgi:hypothetical protein